MRRVNSLWALAAFCLLVVPASSTLMLDYKCLGYGSSICPMDLSKEDMESFTAGQQNEIRLRNTEELGKFIPGHWEKLRLEEMKESDNTDLAKLIARRLIRQIEVMQPQASAWLFLMSGLMPELWERALISYAFLPIDYRLIFSPYAYKL